MKIARLTSIMGACPPERRSWFLDQGFWPAALALLLCVSCDSGSAPENEATPRIPDKLFVATRPDDVRSLAEVKKEAKPGERVVFAARVGGRLNPFVNGRAIMVVADPNLPACSDNPGDGCETPWDYCCETPESLLANTATVQIVDESGRPLLARIDGAHGIKPLRDVVVSGVVATGDASGALVVNADSLWVATD